jgi:dephospho-CoA kinase
MRRTTPSRTRLSQPEKPRTPAPAVSERPLAVAITGGIGAGKSAALAAFARHGAATLSADEVVHRLLKEDTEVRAALVGRWDEAIVDAHGGIDRARVAEIVFADRDELAWLESVLHPRVAARTQAWRDDLSRSDHPPALIAVEVPLLYETGGEQRFDVVVVVTAPAELRAERARVHAAERERRLVPDDEKVRRADFAYVNTGTLDDLDAWVAGVVRQLTEEKEA